MPYTNHKLEHIKLEKPTLLVVDDSVVMRKSINNILAQDFNLVEAADGNEAWQIISRDHSIQVVVADLMMPNKNGFQLLRDIRESVHDRINQMPVIIMTGHEDDEAMKRRALTFGASDFISKPFDALQIRVRAKSYAKHGDTVRKLEKTRKLLSENTTFDALTGLANPRYLQQHGSELLAFAARVGTDVAVLRIDIDKFDSLKRVKGQHASDKVLQHIGKLIDAAVRKEDIVARIGPANFAVVMPGVATPVARVMAVSIHKRISKTAYKLGGTRFRITASAGLVCNDRDEEQQFDNIIKLAEERLLNAIQSGGNQLEFSNPGAERNPISPPKAVLETLTLDEAITLLKIGRTDKVQKQLHPLMEKFHPLLEFTNKQLGLGLESCLKKLQERVIL